MSTITLHSAQEFFNFKASASIAGCKSWDYILKAGKYLVTAPVDLLISLGYE
jgi:hypothetical protein